MRRTAISRVGALVVVLAVVQCGLMSGEAAAGEFRVASCQADRLNFSTQAFSDFATRGMKIKRACNPEGPGLRGLITANVVERGRVARGALALATINAPSGTRFTSFRWAGTVRRRDCRYALQLYADAPDAPPIALKNVRANRGCPRARRAQAAGYRSRTFNISGATRVVQRVICVGGKGRKSCSARGSNYIRTYKAEVGIADTLAPTVGIMGDSALARGEWVRGTQPLNYDASDNVGVRTAQAVVSGQTGGTHQRQCSLASPDGAFANGVPCQNGPGHIDVDTKSFPEGTRALTMQAQDTAGNTATSAEVTARIDNSPPSRVEVRVAGGEEWRNSNNFAVAWTNPPESDRAPIVAAGYKLCASGGGSCNRGEQTGPDIARLAVQVPSPGAWTLSLWRRDAAGNQTETAASVPVTLRYDPEAPRLGFDISPSADPTLLTVQVIDKVSGLADGSIEISREGSNTWQIDEVEQAITARRDGLEDGDPGDLRTPEWRVLSTPEEAPETPDFNLRSVGPPAQFTDQIADVVLAERLREVSALRGFTRLNAPDDLDARGGSIVRLSRADPTWLPCSEVRGEGVFIRFPEERVLAWEQTYRDSGAASVLRDAHRGWRARRGLPPEDGWPCERYVLLHSFAHALIRELALECGYTASSIRERIYAASGADAEPMAGVLLYTAAPDSEGTLGGLVALGEPDQFGPLLRQALERAQLCSSDPLCSEHDPRADNSVHAAACHACQFASETSCERGNRYLDRATISATLARDDVSYFAVS